MHFLHLCPFLNLNINIFYWKITIFNEKFNKHETLDLKLLFQWESWIKKGSKSGLLKTFGFILEFYSINGLLNSWSPHFMITLWNKKSRNVGIPVSANEIPKNTCIYHLGRVGVKNGINLWIASWTMVLVPRAIFIRSKGGLNPFRRIQ